MAFTISSPAFSNNMPIPPKYSCDGENISPPLQFSEIPTGTKSLVVLMEDPDIPEFVKQNLAVESFDHWVLYNIPPETEVLNEGKRVGEEGLNTQNKGGYTGPCPPDGEHRYIFRAYALRDQLSFFRPPTLSEVEKALQKVVIAEAVLIGTYVRSRKMHM